MFIQYSTCEFLLLLFFSILLHVKKLSIFVYFENAFQQENFRFY
jgi:hypothetical protein